MAKYHQSQVRLTTENICSGLAHLIICAAMLLAGSNVSVFADQLATSVMARSHSEQPVIERKTDSESRKYAQIWWPLERNYYYGPRRAPREDFDSSPPPDEKFASETKRKVIQQLRDASLPPPTTGPLMLIVSITKQTVTLYDAGGVVVESPISSGTSENPTPTGIFSIIEKNWWHRSNIYSAAPMPYMQRINWEGVALHAGELPGYPASHGCIRLPYDFALRLWHTTRIGTSVIVSSDELAPVEIAHPFLFVPQPETDRVAATPPDTNAVANELSASSANSSSIAMGGSAGNDTPAYSPRSFLAPKTPPANEVVVQDRVLRPGPISILISQRDQRMYVRKGLEPVFDLPIVITRSGRSLGTHVFTAIAQSEKDKPLRWTVVSMPSTLPAMSSRTPVSSQLLAAAKEALDRLELPKDAVDRVSSMMSVGATLIVTDRGLGRQAFALDSDYMIPTR